MATLGGPNIVTDGLVLALDAANTKSYPGTGTTWNDLSGNGNNVSLFGTFESDSISLYGDGISAFGRTVNTLNLSNINSITVVSIWRQSSSNDVGMIYEHTSNWNTVNSGYGGFGLSSNSQGGGLVANWNHHQLRGNSGYSGFNAESPSTALIQHYTTVHDFSALANNETKVYINSKLITISGGNQYSSNNTSSFGDDFLYLWSRGGVNSFNKSRICCIKIYIRVLTDLEIQQNFNAVRRRFGL